jgi:hypothetical protein
MEPSMKKSARGHMNALTRNLIRGTRAGLQIIGVGSKTSLSLIRCMMDEWTTKQEMAAQKASMGESNRGSHDVSYI